ncbi:helix-turn-helix domain-containing protein [Chryseobacterium sp. HMWF035]|uniref:helix-turn-helix domain-containing protein n=1 Tax=Chryseobacterium sp. HMWF035 TaxID=2056868 RepID=UPI000D578511|nr:helix-turn-helix domain-containing protein [Chryseobacterium sp. HMWF035]PVV51662.1 transposase [Chryseobacterium sp. HMWF035]
MRKFEQPNYNKIFKDIIEKKFYNRKEELLPLLKNQLNVLDVIRINKMIFGSDRYLENHNQKYKSYDKETIIQILDYQRKNQITNIAIAKKFNLSRNTIARWKKSFKISNT